MSIDRQRIEAVRVLSELGWRWDGGYWIATGPNPSMRQHRIEVWAGKTWRVDYDLDYEATQEETLWIIREGKALFGGNPMDDE